MSEDQKLPSSQHPTWGFSVSLAFLAVAGVLFYTPTYLGSPLVTRIVGFVFTCIGILGLGSEIENLAKGKKFGPGSLSFAIGVLFVAVWALIYHFFPNPWIAAVILTILFFAAIGIISGTLEFLYFVFTATPSKAALPLKLLLALAQIIAVAAAFLQILQILKLIQ